jgi:micrococcal nuclease
MTRFTHTLKAALVALTLLAAALACTANPIVVVTPGANTGGGSSSGGSNGSNSSAAPVQGGETGRVVRVIDGDTIDVDLNGAVVRVRYLGINTTETNRGEVCSQEGKQANADLVQGQTVRLVADEDPIDPYDRALRYVFVGSTHVNAELVRQGWAEAVMYEPNDAYWDELIALEQQAAAAGRGCHGMSNIFDDDTYRR